ncbi:hypothetical protein LEMLEM_LOCUS15511 [Lemmus lemmus]
MPKGLHTRDARQASECNVWRAHTRAQLPQEAAWPEAHCDRGIHERKQEQEIKPWPTY